MWFTLWFTLWITPCEAQFGMSGILNPEGPRLFPQTLTTMRHPGKPDLRWKDFNWNYIRHEVESSHYKLFYSKGSEWIVELVIPQIDQQLRMLIDIFHYTPSTTVDDEFSYLILGSRSEFQQINIFNITEGVQGITSTTERTMAIPYWGELETFQHISTHELVHQIHIQKVINLSEDKSSAILELFPLWFTEGMAEYYSLKGIDPESRQYIRDLLLYPKPEDSFQIPKFFEKGEYNFIQVYKVGQAKIDFLEITFGKDATQRILEAVIRRYLTTKRQFTFENIVCDEFHLLQNEIEKKWTDYLFHYYKKEADQLSDSMNAFEELQELGDALDTFSISPDGEFIATREIDPFTEITSIYLRTLSNLNQKFQVTHDHQPDVISLYFMQIPNFTLSNEAIAYIVGTTSGPEIEIQTISKQANGSLMIHSKQRIPLHSLGIIEAHSPTFSPDQKKIAFVGLESKGWENIFVIDCQGQLSLQPLTSGYYTWKDLTWTSEGIYAVSNQTAHQALNLFLVDPHSHQLEQITYSHKNQMHPDKQSTHLFFHSWQSGSSQIHDLDHFTENKLTSAKVGLLNPIYRKSDIYALGLKGGRYHVYKIPKARWKFNPIPAVAPVDTTETTLPWKTHLAPFQPRNLIPIIPSLAQEDIVLKTWAPFFQLEV